MPPPPAPPAPDPDFAQPDFSPAAGTAAEALRALAATAAFTSRCSTASPAPARPKSISRRSPKSSGAAKQTLILMPEIALTGQFLDRFAQRFGVRPAEWHSELTPRKRAAHLGRGRGRRGAGRGRRALGAVPALCGSRAHHRRRRARPGLQAGGRRALSRPRHGGGARAHRKIPIVLASATPSVETEVNARKGRYQRVALPARFGGQRCRISKRSTCAARRRRAAASSRRGSPSRSGSRSRSASRRCCSSTAAAMRR